MNVEDLLKYLEGQGYPIPEPIKVGKSTTWYLASPGKDQIHIYVGDPDPNDPHSGIIQGGLVNLKQWGAALRDLRVENGCLYDVMYYADGTCASGYWSAATGYKVGPRNVKIMEGYWEIYGKTDNEYRARIKNTLRVLEALAKGHTVKHSRSSYGMDIRTGRIFLLGKFVSTGKESRSPLISDLPSLVDLFGNGAIPEDP